MTPPLDIPSPPGADPQARMVARRPVEDLLLLSASPFGEEPDAALAAVRDVLAGASDAPFDPDAVVNRMIAQGLRDDGGFWRSRYVASGRRLVAALCGERGDRPPDVERLPPRRFRVALSRTFDLARTPARRLRLPLPLADAHLQDLQLSVDADAGDLHTEPGRLEAKVDAALRRPVTLSARLAFIASPIRPHGLAAGLGDPTPWLALREGPVVVTPAVTALADRLAGAERDPLAQARAFRDHLLGAMVCGRVPPEAIAGRAATDWVVENRWFDCRLGAALLVALCRARAIPARLVGGYLLWAAPAEHYWMEAWIPGAGWTPFDLLAADLSAAGRDAAWRDLYAGVLDYRMTTQVFPHVFTGAPGVRMGPAWRRLSRRTGPASDAGGEIETQLVSVPGGAPVFTETVRVLKD